MAQTKRKLYSIAQQQVTLLDGAKAYAQLRAEVTKAGILDRSYGYYSVMAVFVLGGFFFTLYQIIVTPFSMQLVLWIVLFGMFGVQIGGFLHDAGHRAVVGSIKSNDIIGHIAGALVSMGFSSWKYRHNLHHAHSNEKDVDPDIIDAPFLSFTMEKFREKKGIWKKMAAHQEFFYYPLVLLFNIGLRTYADWYFRNNLKKVALWEVAIYYSGVFAWYVLPFFVFDIPKAILFVVLVNVTMGLYFLNILASNHKAMPKLEKGRKISFMEQQIMTSCNVAGNWFSDILYMGLNYQIEHHLFPNCPRNKLHKITPFVLAICRQKKIDYTRVGFIESNKMILNELKQIAATSKAG